MTKLGKNLKITAPDSVRAAVRTLYAALGATRHEPSATLDVFAIGGSNIGYAYVADAEALTPAQMRCAPWHEIAVDDVARTVAVLEELGLERIAYADQAHAYFAAPGGAVFRVAAAAT